MPREVTQKKKGSALGLQRRVKARKQPEPEPEYESQSEDEAPSEGGVGEEGESEEDEDEGSDAESESAEEGPSKAHLSISNISFGTLAKAQASMPSVKRRKGKQEESDDSDASASDAGRDRDRKKNRSHRPEKRSSKHAPTEMTSKRPVSRKREFDTVAKPQVRDPRFDPTINSTPGYDEHRAKKAYAFLDEYRASEMAELRAELKRERDPAERQRIERLLMSMESKKKAEDRKEREHRIIVEHRRAEKELVKQGKQPFYLKKSEQKKRLLTEQFKGMKRKQVDKSIERRRKKVATRERIELEDMQRRT